MSDYAASNTLFLWFVAEPMQPRLVGDLKLLSAGKGVSLEYAPTWLASQSHLS